jgi:hypothetical protein
MRRRTLLFAAMALACASFASAQGQRPSPAANAECKFADGKTVHIAYSSPRMRGRKIFGELVPFGEVWRTGANEATTFVTTADVTIGGKSVPAGSYTLYTVPQQNAWTLVVSRKTGQWGIPYPGESEDLIRAPMTVSKTASPVEDFTIGFQQAGGTCTLQIEWDTTRASADIVEKR